MARNQTPSTRSRQSTKSATRLRLPLSSLPSAKKTIEAIKQHTMPKIYANESVSAHTWRSSAHRKADLHIERDDRRPQQRDISTLGGDNKHHTNYEVDDACREKSLIIPPDWKRRAHTGEREHNSLIADEAEQAEENAEDADSEYAFLQK